MAILKCQEGFDIKTASRNLGRLDARGLALRPTHFKLEEFFTKRPALNAVKAYGTPTNGEIIAGDIANNDFEVLGTNMTTNLVTFATNGGIILTTAGANNDQGILLPHLDTNMTPWTSTTWGTGKQTRWEAIVETQASIAAVTLWAGLKLTNTSVATTDNDQAFFRFAGGTDTNWQLITSRTNVDTTTDTGVAVAASTIYHLEVEFDANRRVNAYINGVQVASNLAAMTDSVNLIPYIGVQATTGAAKAIGVKYEAISRTFA